MSLHKNNTEERGETRGVRQKQSKAKRILHEYSENQDHSIKMNSFINTIIEKNYKNRDQITTWESTAAENNQQPERHFHIYNKKISNFQRLIRHQTNPNRTFEAEQLSFGSPKNKQAKCSISLFCPTIEEVKISKDHQKLRNKFSSYVSAVHANKILVHSRPQMSGGGFQKINQRNQKLLRCDAYQTIQTTKYRSIKLEDITLNRNVNISSQIFNKGIHKIGQQSLDQLEIEAKLRKLKPIEHAKKLGSKKNRQPLDLEKRAMHVCSYSGEKLQWSEQFKTIQDLIKLEKI